MGDIHIDNTEDAPFEEPNAGPAGDEQNEEARQEEAEKREDELDNDPDDD